MYLTHIDDIDLKNELKNTVRNSINVEEEIYGCFSDKFMENSGLNFCPIETQLFLPDDETCYAKIFISYCIKNNYDYLFAIDPEYIDHENILKKMSDEKEQVHLAYKFFTNKDSIDSFNGCFFYSKLALLFPEDRSFFVLLTDAYDILAGSRYFIEYITGSDILKSVDSFEYNMGLESFSDDHPFKKFHNKFKKLSHDKYDK